MRSLVEHKLDASVDAINNIYSIILSNRQLTKTQQTKLKNFSSVYNDDKERSKESRKLSNTNVKCNLSNSEIEKLKIIINAKTKKIQNMWFTFSGIIIILLSIIFGVWFAQTQYKKSGYKSLGKVIAERK